MPMICTTKHHREVPFLLCCCPQLPDLQKGAREGSTLKTPSFYELSCTHSSDLFKVLYSSLYASFWIWCAWNYYFPASLSRGCTLASNEIYFSAFFPFLLSRSLFRNCCNGFCWCCSKCAFLCSANEASGASHIFDTHVQHRLLMLMLHMLSPMKR